LTWGRQEKPLVLAHRGASADELENTLPAFRRARADGADGVELDVMRCASGEVIVFHDDDLQRLAGRPGDVRSLNWAELSAVDLSGRRVPLLSQVLDELGPMVVNIELKSQPDWRRRLSDDGLAVAVAELIRAHGVVDRALVSSFDPLLLRRFQAAAPDVATGLLFAHDQSRPLRHAWSAPLLRPTAVHPDARLVDPIAVEGWRARGYAIHVWTVDEPAELRWLAALGVDAVITNRPAVARKALESVTSVLAS
jgi:glycerophosphoryl diester phosphodiesterase